MPLFFLLMTVWNVYFESTILSFISSISSSLFISPVVNYFLLTGVCSNVYFTSFLSFYLSDCRSSSQSIPVCIFLSVTRVCTSLLLLIDDCLECLFLIYLDFHFVHQFISPVCLFSSNVIMFISHLSWASLYLSECRSSSQSLSAVFI